MDDNDSSDIGDKNVYKRKVKLVLVFSSNS